MAAGDKLGQRMAASYTVSINGIERTKAELAKLDGEIKELRRAQYSPVTSVTIASQLGGKDLFVTKLDALEGRVQTATEKAMAAAMAKARRAQTQELNAAVTPTGLSGKPKRRKTAGRNVDSHMINSIGTNVETMKRGDFTQVTGWHGWGTEVRKDLPDQQGRYIAVQEKGNRGTSTQLGGSAAKAAKANFEAGGVGSRRPIMPANSLGFAIPIAREFLKTELAKLRRP